MIEVRGLSKTFRVHRRKPGLLAALRSLVSRPMETVHAVRDLSFSIAPGERVGFLGPNGAGKTTTLKILSGLLHPSAGTARVAGFVPQERATTFLQSITLVMGQKQQLLWDLPPAETYAMNRAIYDVPRAQADATVNELRELLDVGDLIFKPTRQLSLGERMKCELIAALLHRPRVLFLDEPTIGLDVSMQARMREFIRTYNERFSATVILTSHYMEDVAALCPRVIVIDKGKLIHDGDLRALVRRVRPERRVTVRLSQPAPQAFSAAAPPGRIVVHDDAQVVLSVPADRVNDAVRAALAVLPVADLSIEDPPLEDVMRELFQTERDAATQRARADATAPPPSQPAGEGAP